MSTALTTLVDVKLFLGITDTSQDAFLNAMITRMSGFIERQCNRVFGIADYTEYYDADEANGGVLNLKQGPLVSISHLYNDVTRAFGADTEIDAADFVFYSPEAMVQLLEDQCFDVGFQAIKILYRAGYTTIPDDLAQGCIDLIAFKFYQRAAGGGTISSKTLADASFTYVVDKGGSEGKISVPSGTLAVIQSYGYKRVYVI